ncbi:two-component system, cell cycle response regulator DivK [Thermanaeromonas toyohensis ToBE]|uniref:Stage 0 sporulation protein A homolog n=1 Tax=Thermanaeromonas toyohensis ToBE TaxID=698762 RepID=A0A1W1V854_9FIRM|nr:response regulator [Thermanaeromonas toyohensis]SMB89657.1 two-component system, cell cycle response regulator DivK [Thermanaeromonas toyohensis ToBE]
MKPKILVVEDNEANMVLLRDILAIIGSEVLEATTGQEGLRLAREEKPQLILMDIQLPDIDGITLTRLLKQDPATSHIPIIAVTSYAYEKEKDLFSQAGGDGYLTKPIEIESLLKVVTQFIRGEKIHVGEAQNTSSR